ncbi:MAG: UDP-N-acetylmuramoyl-L-alanyl-D-glutamate--2,6-diaminopimelate ligase [Bauldia sp.]
MRLQDLAIPELAVGAGAGDIIGATADSRAVKPGFLFAALKGSKADGTAFIGQAVASGAAAILVGNDVRVASDPGVPVVRAADPRRALALVAARLWPRQPDILVAVTGTSGKTSVAEFTRQIFQRAGHAAASVGTLGVVTAGGTVKGSLTTPDPAELHATLDGLVGQGITHAAMEASSHGLDQRRLDGVRLSAAAFTNLGRDHLDYHATLADYLAAKLHLFETLLPAGRAAVIDVDSEAGRTVATVAERRGHRLIRTGRTGRELRLIDLSPAGFEQQLRLEVFGRSYTVHLPLAGAFQAANAIVAAGLAIGSGTAPETVLAAVEGLVGAPGRLERVGQTRDGALIFVDYAHKPDAVANALAALRPMTGGRLVVVIGAGGDRDPGKRAVMGRLAADAADRVIVTDDNPRSEDPAKIRRAVLEGAGAKGIEIGDRREAIRAAIRELRVGDVLCIAGKGHETGQIVGNTVLPFSDKAVAAEILGETGA